MKISRSIKNIGNIVQRQYGRVATDTQVRFLLFPRDTRT